MVVHAATERCATAWTVKTTKSCGDGTDCDEFIFTFIDIWSIVLLTFDSAAAVALVDLGTTDSITIEDCMAFHDEPNVIGVAAAGTASNEDCNPVKDTDVGDNFNTIDFVVDA